MPAGCNGGWQASLQSVTSIFIGNRSAPSRECRSKECQARHATAVADLPIEMEDLSVHTPRYRHIRCGFNIANPTYPHGTHSHIPSDTCKKQTHALNKLISTLVLIVFLLRGARVVRLTGMRKANISAANVRCRGEQGRRSETFLSHILIRTRIRLMVTTIVRYTQMAPGELLGTGGSVVLFTYATHIFVLLLWVSMLKVLYFFYPIFGFLFATGSSIDTL